MEGNLQPDDQLRGEMKRSSPQSIAENTEEMKEWEDELERLQKLVPIQASRDRLKRNELPALERQIKEQEAAIPAISNKAEKVRWFTVHFVVPLTPCQASDKTNELKKLLKDITSMKQHATNVARTQKETDRLRDEISGLESELKSTGSTKTADEVEAELDALTGDLYALLCFANFPHFVEWLHVFTAARTTKRSRIS
jgi:DNA repair protein RAD50